MNTLETEIEKALDYRGDVTVYLKDGTVIAGYLFNRARKGSMRCPEPFIELMLEGREEPLLVKYAAIRNVGLTGEDAAAGKSWEEWVAREEVRKKTG